MASSFAEVRESPLANSVTSCPNATSSSVSQCTTRSVPPYSLGGTASVSGATCAMRISASPVCHACEQKPWPTVGTGVPFWGTFSHLRSSFDGNAFLLLPRRGLVDAIRYDQSLFNVDAAGMLRGDGVVLRNPGQCSSRNRARDDDLEILVHLQ